MDKTSQSTKLTLFLILRSISAINIKSGNNLPGFQKRKNMVSLCIQTVGAFLNGLALTSKLMQTAGDAAPLKSVCAAAGY